VKILTLLINNDFQISAPQYPTHYTSRGNRDILDIVIHQNVRLSEITVSDVLDSDCLPIFFNILVHISAREISPRVETLTDWERFRSLASDLIQLRPQLDTVEAEEAVSTFIASVASAYRLPTRKLTLSDPNSAPSDLDHFLHLKRRLRRLWQETRDAACKTTLHWVTNTVHRMIQGNSIERWETKISHSEVSPRAIRPCTKSFMRRDRPKSPSAIHSPSGLKFLPLEKPTSLPTVLKTNPHHITCVAKS